MAWVALRPNTVLLKWPKDESDAEWFGCTLRTISNLKRSIVAMKISDPRLEPWSSPKGTIDVWWRGEQNGALMLLLAHLLANNAAWRGRKIRLMRMIGSEAGKVEVTEHLRELATHSRIVAEPRVVVNDDIFQTIGDESAAAAIVIIGFDTPVENDEVAFYQRMEKLTSALNRVVFVKSHGEAALDI